MIRRKRNPTNQRVVVGCFEREEDLIAAAKACRDLGMEMIDACTPYPVHGIDPLLGIKRTRLPWICLTGGVLGLSGGIWLQYWTTSQSWPLNVGGKPWDSLPAFVPVAFELMVLLAGLATAFGLWLRSGLVPGRSPRRHFPRATDDRFYLVVSSRGAALDSTRMQKVLRENGAAQCWEEEA